MTQSAARQVVLAAPMREFLAWFGRCPRTYTEAMDAWASHCPRYTLWEDALAVGFIEIQNHGGAPIDAASITLTPLGRSALSAS